MGPGSGHAALLPRPPWQRRNGPQPGHARDGALRRADHEREGNRPAGRRVPVGTRTLPRATTRARGRRARAWTARRTARTAGHFLGWLEGGELPAAYAGADMFVFPSATDTFGQVVLEAQASGVPVVAVDAGGPRSLIEHRVSGLLCPAEAGPMSKALLELARSPLLRERIATAGVSAARARTWDRALGRLADGYRAALEPGVAQRSAA